MDRPHILFDVIAKDWEKPSPHIMTQRIMEQLHPGAIILLHDADENNIEDRSYTVQTLKTIIEAVREKGYQFLTISELLKEDTGS
jgi:peptidoglycan/xylan/chitin deacetylase (PgdA/CDA1 family)